MSPLTDVSMDENAVPPFRLPDLLRAGDGHAITDILHWRRRRADLLDIFAAHVYGRTPTMVPAWSWRVVETADDALGGGARRVQAEITFGAGSTAVAVAVLIYLPLAATRPVAAFVGLNFEGNHSTDPDPAIRIAPRWGADAARGAQARRWQMADTIARGYAVVTACYHDIDPDDQSGNFADGLHPLFFEPGQTRPAHDQWGQIGVWAWGLSRILDALIRHVPDIDAARIALIGHSRLGKTALWAAAQDERFALVICNQSGTGGASLWRRRFGERLHHFRHHGFQHWFCADLQEFAQREDDLPVDQHQLLALIAPRPLYVSCAIDDLWGDPHGSFLACRAAGPAWELLGTSALPAGDWPAPGAGLVGTIGYHLRPGKHDVIAEDWSRFLDFADRHLR